MSGMRQKIQYSLALEPVDQGETPVSGYHQGTEPFVAKPTSESPASAEQLMEEVCDRENLVRAWKRVRSNRGCQTARNRDPGSAWKRDPSLASGQACPGSEQEGPARVA